MKTTTKFFIAVAALGAIVGPMLFSIDSPAYADRTDVVLSAGARVERYCVSPIALEDGGAGVNATVEGRAFKSDGGHVSATHSVILPRSNAVAAQLLGLADGGALDFWKGREGL